MDDDPRQRHLLDTWAIHARIVGYLLDAIPAEALAGVSASKGRGVGEQFAHLHNVRLMWLKEAAPELLEGLAKVEKSQANDKAGLRAALDASAAAIGELVRRALAGGRVKGFKPHPTAFVGYLIAHENYHHGEIGIVLAQSGYPLDKKTAFGLWEWGVRRRARLAPCRARPTRPATAQEQAPCPLPRPPASARRCPIPKPWPICAAAGRSPSWPSSARRCGTISGRTAMSICW